MTTTPPPTPVFISTLQTPTHATSAVFNDTEDTLAVGSDDGSVRLYKLPDTRVVKAIRGLGESVSGIVFGSVESGDVFIAAGHSIYRFPLNIEVMILKPEDVSFVVDVREKPEDEDDALNNIAIDCERNQIAFTSDSGGVGVLDIATGQIKRMRPKHTAIAYVVDFIPGRPNEIVSGGYDCMLMHYNVKEGTLMSKFQFPSTAPFAPGISRSPPFITSLSLSPSGSIVAGCADGRVWINRLSDCVEGGTQASSIGNAKKKKGKGRKGEPHKRWKGLDAISDSGTSVVKVADGLVPVLDFGGNDTLVVSSLLGEVSSLDLNSPVDISPSPEANEGNANGEPIETPSFQPLWKVTSRACAKVNALALAPRSGWLVVAGLDETLKKGAVGVWSIKTSHTDAPESPS